MIDENHPFSNFPQKREASLGELNPIEIKSNMEIFDFELSEEDMKTIDQMDKGKRLGPDPANFDF